VIFHGENSFCKKYGLLLKNKREGNEEYMNTYKPFILALIALCLAGLALVVTARAESVKDYLNRRERGGSQEPI
jgi:hypothetical protein